MRGRKLFLLALIITLGFLLLFSLPNSSLDHFVRGTFLNAGFGNRKHISRNKFVDDLTGTKKKQSALKRPESNTLVHDEPVNFGNAGTGFQRKPYIGFHNKQAKSGKETSVEAPSSTGGEHGNSISIGLDGIKNVQAKQSAIKKMHFKQIDHPRTKITKESISRIKAIQKVIKTHANPAIHRHSKYKAQSDGSDFLVHVNDSTPRSSILAYPANARQKHRLIAAKYKKLLHRPSCSELFRGKKKHLKNARLYQTVFPKKSKSEEDYIQMTNDCPNFIRSRRYIQEPLSQLEADFPIAYTIAVYKDIEQAERLLRLLYMPQNLYCIHIDIAAPFIYHKAWQSITKCFPNVFIASKLANVEWGRMSVVEAYTNCMQDLVRKYRGKWKYNINLTGQELPLKTNYQIVRILKSVNGTNLITGEISKTWENRYKKIHVGNDEEIGLPHVAPPYNMTIYKGSCYGAFTWKFVEYMLEDRRAQEYLIWCKKILIPDEMFWNSLNFNPHLNAPGGYKYAGKPGIRHKYYLKAVVWQIERDRPCHGRFVRSACIWGLEDLSTLLGSRFLFANKFHMNYDYLAYDCVEEYIRNATHVSHLMPFDVDSYANLDIVRNSRHNGI